MPLCVAFIEAEKPLSQSLGSHSNQTLIGQRITPKVCKNVVHLMETVQHL